MLPKRLMITLLAGLMALAPGLAAAAADEEGPINKNKEGAWSMQRHADGECSAWYAVAPGGFMLNARRGPFGVVASNGDHLKGKSAAILTDAGAIPFKPGIEPTQGGLYADNLLDQTALVTLKKATYIAVTLDGMLVVGFETAGTGLPQLIDDLAACGRGEKGWWDARVAPAPLHWNKERTWSLTVIEDQCFIGGHAEGDVAVVIAQSAAGNRVLSLMPPSKGRLERAQLSNQEAWTPLPLTREYDHVRSEILDARQNFILNRAQSLFIDVDGKSILNIDLKDTGYPAILGDLAACAAGKSGWWGDGPKPAAK